MEPKHKLAMWSLLAVGLALGFAVTATCAHPIGDCAGLSQWSVEHRHWDSAVYAYEGVCIRRVMVR
ncbi:MAG TPA: hypothetical protein VGG28_32785 [Kofleriaceae bacterium]|jgi:hypothetical protein